MFKYLFKKDTYFATIAVFVVMGLLALIPINTHVLDPFKLALADFDYNDLVYAKMGKNAGMGVDTGIVVVNIGNADRTRIGEIIQHTSAMNPKVIGVDVLFNEKREVKGDSILSQIFLQSKNVIMAYNLMPSSEAGEGKKSEIHDEEKLDAKSYFRTGDENKGYVNFVGEDEGVIRHFIPMVEDHDTKEFLSFSAAIVKKADPKAFDELQYRGEETEIINYIHRADKYVVLDGEELVQGKINPALIRNKIVLVGYVSQGKDDVEDKHFTPLNDKFTGRAIPDMSGVFIHANIIRMVLDNNYVHRMPSWLNWLLAVLLCWLHMAYFINSYKHHHLWFHLAAKTAQIISAILFVYLGLMYYYYFNVKINMTATLAAIILAVDVLYFYEAFATWLHKKFGYQTIFTHEAHH